ncbi:hypothetical protein K432DRAFT_449149 [Lepidopterella palustris CBS 459.81]|uniref:Uncharacterized protein n=1 Tax=Lepidopterella palustris CBS 459.81 TaxID=1314670 RepID=A0A8E2DX44_9PEZI|nr:hypothetical protein K432DRAFT_449149 [Lepidopterella palustris CBS 459.81]
MLLLWRTPAEPTQQGPRPHIKAYLCRYMQEHREYSSFFGDNFASFASADTYVAIMFAVMQAGLATDTLSRYNTLSQRRRASPFSRSLVLLWWLEYWRPFSGLCLSLTGFLR